MVEEAIPQPGKDEVVVEMKAFGLNRADQLFYHGYYLVTPQFPNPLGVEGAGVIHTVGDGVSLFSVGDRVSIVPAFDFSKYGVIGDYAVVPKEAVIAMPESFSFKDGSSIWMSFLTAYAALVLKGKLQDREAPYVVVSAASSSVGLAAIQIAKRHGATVIATTRTADKKAFLLENGADEVIATAEEDFKTRIMELTQGKGFDLAVDALAGSFLSTLGEVAAFEASIVVYGAALFMEDIFYPLFPAIAKGLDVSSVHININLLQHPKRLQEAVRNIVSGFEAGAYRSVVDQVFKLEDFREAYAYLENGSLKGKVLLEK
tara:strand:- start:13303 stop:14253 length:951 start_codon:yes stop_codon:yes gene_type:complete